MANYKPSDKPGVILVGSHVRKTTEQLRKLLEESDTLGIEIDVKGLRDDPSSRDNILQKTLALVNQTWQEGKTPVVYTSREELTFTDIQQRLEFGKIVSSLLMDVVRGLPPKIGFLISKGGITSNDVLSDGLNLTTARLLGQILPGCSVIRTGADHPQFPNLPVVLFPGNVGENHSLATGFKYLRNS